MASIAAKQEKMHVVVNGDIVLDWHLSTTGPLNRGPKGEEFMKASPQWGGAMLLADLLTADQNLGKSFEIHKPEIPRDVVISKVEPATDGTDGETESMELIGTVIHDYALWEPIKEKVPVWRIKQNLGYTYPQIDDKSKLSPDKTPKPFKIKKDAKNARLVIIDDANLGFRDLQSKQYWPEALADDAIETQQPWILIKCSSPIETSPKDAKDSKSGGNKPIWLQLLEAHPNIAEKTIIVIPASDLRLADLEISKGLSWERTAQDLLWELLCNPKINDITKCGFVVVTFGASGALLLTNKKKSMGTQADLPYECKLVYDPREIENSWEQNIQGRMVGITTTMVGAIARQVMIGCLSNQKPDVEKGIKKGLVAIRSLYSNGFGKPGAVSTVDKIFFPSKRLVEVFESYEKNERDGKEDATFSSVKLPNPTDPSIEKERPSWTILEETLKTDEMPTKILAEKIVLDGLDKVLKKVPLGVFGKVSTVDRNEIEGYRSIRSLIFEFISQEGKPEAQTNPLNIAVFGAPGSGKSFGVTQVAQSLFKDKERDKIQRMEFNMSQLVSEADLCLALHQVRDVVLQGKIPLVFWDEFDTRMQKEQLGWLKYFLMPMQDGKFQEGEVTHYIGRSIFIFAGGTSKSLKEFSEKQKMKEYENTKLPDFISRLRGIVQIIGVNQVSSNDEEYIIRRAVLLRSQFEMRFPKLFNEQKRVNIDSGVLRAFLQIREFKHGVRSIESLILMSALADRKKFERSCLPPESQMRLHVDSREFMALVKMFELDEDTIEKIARESHEFYCSRGLLYNDPSSNIKLSFDELKPGDREQNRRQTREIPLKLALCGFSLVPKRDYLQSATFSDDEIEQMAKIEHINWVRMKIKDGWRWSEKRDNVRKYHPSLLPWRMDLEENRADFNEDEIKAMNITKQLPESEKLKSIASIKDIPILFRSTPYPQDQLEKMLKVDHHVWIHIKAKEGWQFSAAFDAKKKTHPNLLPWQADPEEIRSTFSDDELKAMKVDVDNPKITVLPQQVKNEYKKAFLAIFDPYIDKPYIIVRAGADSQ